MYKFNNEKLKKLRDCQPYHIYQRVNITETNNPFLFPLPFGFWYVLRELRVHYPDHDTPAGNIFSPLSFSVYLMGVNKWPQNAPVPFELSCIPAAAGVAVNAANELTTGVITLGKMINSIHPVRDNLNITIVRLGVAPFVPFIDVDCVGYLMPQYIDDMWKGGE